MYIICSVHVHVHLSYIKIHPWTFTRAGAFARAVTVHVVRLCSCVFFSLPERLRPPSAPCTCPRWMQTCGTLRRLCVGRLHRTQCSRSRSRHSVAEWSPSLQIPVLRLSSMALLCILSSRSAPESLEIENNKADKRIITPSLRLTYYRFLFKPSMSVSYRRKACGGTYPA